MRLDPAVWGPHFWFVLHTFAISYPLQPDAATKRAYYEFVTNLPIFIPNDQIAKHVAQLLQQYPISQYLDSRDQFIMWAHFIHNRVNAQLEKEQLPFDRYHETYYAHYRPAHEKLAELAAFREKMAYGGIVLGLVIVAFCGWRKG